MKLDKSSYHNEAYYYDFVPGDENGAHVIFLSGGPGLPTMGQRSQKSFGLPASTNLILIDPRGVGCNKLDYFSGKNLSTENVVNDIIAVIQNEQLKNYFVYAQSYGTMVATMLASELERRGLRTPKAIILEGTFARSTHTYEEYNGDVFKEWELVKKNFSPEIREVLSLDAPLQYEPDVWGNFVTDLMVKRADSMGGDSLAVLNGLSNSASPMLRSMLVGQLDSIKEFVASSNKDGNLYPVDMDFYKQITCSELLSERPVLYTGLSYLLKNGVLMEPREGDFCKSVPFAFDYHVNNHSSKVRTYYFHGSKDPWTPVRNLEEHVKAQSKADRFVTLHGLASHGPLVHSLKKCRDKIWKNILGLSDQQVFANTLNRCEASYLLKFEHLPAGK